MRWRCASSRAGAGEDDLRPLLLGELRHPEAERRIREHAGDQRVACRRADPWFLRSGMAARRYVAHDVRWCSRARSRCSGDRSRPLWRGSALVGSAPMRNRNLGGTGPAGSGLALRLAAVGYHVVIGSRSQVPGRWRSSRRAAREVAPPGRLDRRRRQPTAASGELVVIATPWDAAATTAKSSAATASPGKVVHLAWPTPSSGWATSSSRWCRPAARSRRSVQAAVPTSLVVAAFHHVPAKELGDIDHPIESDVLVCSRPPDGQAPVHRASVTQIPDMPPARRRRAVQRHARSRPSPRCCSS